VLEFHWYPQPKKDLKNDIVFITGAASGIGRLIAFEFAKRKVKHIIICDIQEEALKNTEKELKNLVNVSSFKCDITDRKEVYDLAKKISQDIGDVTILVNNAGTVTGKNIMECSDEQILNTFQVNTISHFWTVKAFLPAMYKKNRGHIVTIASVAGTVGSAKLSDYCASKFAAFGFDESLRLEFNKCGRDIKTTCICPFFINTGMFEGVKSKFRYLLPILEPSDVASRTVEAVETNEEVVIMPRFCYITLFARALLPTKAFDEVGKFFGNTTYMDNFTGRTIKHKK